MNWRRFYATFQIWFTVGLSSAFGAGCYAVVIIGICRKVLGVSDVIAVFGVGLPSFIALMLFLIRLLPTPLRRAGMLSDDPITFGPWFR